MAGQEANKINRFELKQSRKSVANEKVGAKRKLAFSFGSLTPEITNVHSTIVRDLFPHLMSSRVSG